MIDTIADIHDFWFGELDENGLCTSDRHALWFGGSAQTDNYCREHFSASLALALEGRLRAWTQTDRGLVALVVLLDQFSRNIHRGTAQAFAGDRIAVALAQNAIDVGRHLRLPAIHRVFLYLPLEHCEEMGAQEDGVALFEELAELTGDPQIASYSRYAIAHRDIIAWFGRFPHRNAALGRVSSAAELAYMETHSNF